MLKRIRCDEYTAIPLPNNRSLRNGCSLAIESRGRPQKVGRCLRQTSLTPAAYRDMPAFPPDQPVRTRTARRYRRHLMRILVRSRHRHLRPNLLSSSEVRTEYRIIVTALPTSQSTANPAHSEPHLRSNQRMVSIERSPRHVRSRISVPPSRFSPFRRHALTRAAGTLVYC
jgi:hypothetical protein